jgi:hypothetical protein
MGCTSANQMADIGNKIQKYIQGIASSTTVASSKKTAEWSTNVSKYAKTKDVQLQAMTAQIQALTNTVATILTTIVAAGKENLNPNSGRGGGSGGGSGGNGSKHTFKYTHNMGGYYVTHGHHPIGINLTSMTCRQKRKGHNNSAIATN